MIRQQPMLVRLAAVAVLLMAATTACTADRTANMSCEELRQDNLAQSKVYPPTDESMTRVRENNERVQDLGCAWANDDHSGPADA